MKKLGVHDLTYIAEALGKRNPPPVRYLCALAKHADPVVREGVIYGLSTCLARTDAARAPLERMADDDSSALIRSIAAEALKP